MNVLDHFFHRGKTKNLDRVVSDVNAEEPRISSLSDDEIVKESARLKEELRTHGDYRAVLPAAFALVRETAKRTLSQRPFDVQIMGGMVLHEGGVAEMLTGEGKTLAAVAPVYLNALSGKGVHVVTVNEYLARRDAVWMGQIYRALGLSVSCLVSGAAYLYDPTWKIPESERKETDEKRDETGGFLVAQDYLRPISRREAYLADVTYGTNHEFGFDYLRDNLSYDPGSQTQRGHYYAVIDEVDSVLIDEARTPLIISAPDAESSELYKTFARAVIRLTENEDYAVDEKRKSVLITDPGIEKMEKMLGIQDLYGPEHFRIVHFLEESLKAHALFKRDKDYVVRNGEVIIVDEFTGRMLHGRRYNGGLHQAIEAKEGVHVKQESRTYAKISIQNYFRMYEKVAGMTGTAQTSAEEFFKVYGLDVTSIPSNVPVVREDLPDGIYKTAEAKWRAVAADIKERYAKGQPVLVGTTSIEKSELLSSLLSGAGIAHEVLNAKKHEEEGRVVAQAGKKGSVTVATNMAGRGVDIILGGNPPSPEEAKMVRDAGGLHVIGTERHEARRIDDQLRGRAGRQGDPGSSQFFLSLEDDLLRVFGGEKVKNIMERLKVPEDQPIEMGIVSKAVRQAQARVEGANFDIRKHLLEYDDVLNRQRRAVYKRRQELLESISRGILPDLIFKAAREAFDRIRQAIENRPESEDNGYGEDNGKEVKKVLKEAGILKDDTSLPDGFSDDELESLLTKRSMEVALVPGTVQRLLSILDLLWMNHLENVDALHESVLLRAYGHKDPLVEYREESHRLYQDLWANWNGWILGNAFKGLDAKAGPVSGNVVKVQQGSVPSDKTGRNDPCPCGSGKKYKKCHGK